MACGRAIITTDWPGCRDAVIDGENGYLVPVKNSSELYNKMSALAGDKELLKKMANKAYDVCSDTYEVGIINNAMRNIMGY